jgi:hypothetical protein
MNLSTEEVYRLVALVAQFDGTKAKTRQLLREARRFRRAGLWEESDVTIDFVIHRLSTFRNRSRLALRLARLAVKTCPDRLHLLLLSRVLDSFGLAAESRVARAAAAEAPNLHPPAFPGLGLDDGPFEQ